MKIDYTQIPLNRNEEKGRFELEVNGHIAFIKFEENGKIINLTHTEAPMELRGTGAAGAMTEKVFKFIEDNGFTMITECPYLDKYIIRHPEWEKIKDDSYTTPEPRH